MAPSRGSSTQVSGRQSGKLDDHRLCCRLVKAGLVMREASTEDRRIKRVVVTAAGLEVYEKVKAEATALRRELLAHTDPKKLLAATELLEGLQGIIDAAQP
jgi:DNA-binding MarR family transcriptional regulator